MTKSDLYLILSAVWTAASFACGGRIATVFTLLMGAAYAVLSWVA